MVRNNRSLFKVLLSTVTLIFTVVSAAFGANVILRWDANNPAPEGYRVFARQSNQSYNYAHPIWESNQTTCTLTGLVDGVTYHFVVRAYDGALESADSTEVTYTPSAVVPNQVPTGPDGSTSVSPITVNVLKLSNTDVDGDSVPDVFDRFPYDPNEWADNDCDGTGDNQDADDDNDGIPDTWEITYGLDPRNDDSGRDADGDGLTNIAEFHADSNPTNAPANKSPDAPVVDTADQAVRVGLTPVLMANAYYDADNDDHYQSQWQISNESNFSTLILGETSHAQLTAYAVGQMVLDADTKYYWRVKYIDERNGTSEWSQTASFTTLTVEDSDDADINGIPDSQEVDESADVDEDGIPDIHEADIMSVNTVEGQTTIGVKTLSSGVTLVSIKSLSTETISDKSVKLGFGLIGFKLYLLNGVTTASVEIHFDTRVPENAMLYKYTLDSGWQPYAHAVFASDRKSVALLLEDGGAGDEDGVANGVIVDPSGIALNESDYASLATTTGTASGSGGGGCFIATGTNNLPWVKGCRLHPSPLVALILLALGGFVAMALSILFTGCMTATRC